MRSFDSGLAAVRSLAEIPEGAGAVRWVHPEWRERFPWAVQGTTGRGSEEGTGDFALFRDGALTGPSRPWVGLANALGFRGIVHAPQVHGTRVAVAVGGGAGLVLGPEGDGHASRFPGVLMGVTVADCVPAFLLDPVRQGIAVLHAGWRGTAAGMLEEGIAVMERHFGSVASTLYLHLGPAICGSCYEVGPEVHEGLGLSVPRGPEPVDLRRVLASRALKRGVPADRMTVSAFCTRCHRDRFFSHRGGDAARQVGFLGIRSGEAGLCESCRWVREIRNRRGSRFLLCRKSEEDPSFPRYPELPVLSCRGYQPAEPPGDPGPDD